MQTLRFWYGEFDVMLTEQSLWFVCEDLEFFMHVPHVGFQIVVISDECVKPSASDSPEVVPRSISMSPDN